MNMNPLAPDELPHAGFALFYGTGSFAVTTAAEDDMRAGFKSDAGYCLDAPDRMPSGATRTCAGDVTTTFWSRPWFRMREVPPAAPAPTPRSVELLDPFGVAGMAADVLDQGITIKPGCAVHESLRHVAQQAPTLGDLVRAVDDALRAATAYTELSTGNGVQQQPPAWAINPDGDGYDAEAIAKKGRAALALLGTLNTGA